MMQRNSTPDCSHLDVAILEIDEKLSHGGIDEMTPDALDALIHSYLDPQCKAAINALKHP